MQTYPPSQIPGGPCRFYGFGWRGRGIVGSVRAVRVAFVLVVLATSAMAARVDTERMERLSVGVTTLTMVDPGRDRTFETEVWYPATIAGRNAPLRRGRFPLVLLAHGYCGFRTNYEYLATHLARWGFLVAAPD